MQVFGIYDVYLYVSVDSFETAALWGCGAMQKYLDGVQNVNTSVWKPQSTRNDLILNTKIV